MIPVLIAPAYNRHDLLRRMLESIDHRPVGRTLIVDNGRSYSTLEEPRLPYDLNESIWRPPFQSIGYGGAINFGITQTAEEPWWLWVSNDIEFYPGALDQVVANMGNAEDERRAQVVTGGFTWGAINRRAVDAVGLVDDWNFFPIYFDDNDYAYRCHLAGVRWVEMGGTRHGDDDHPGSATILSDPKLRERNHETFRENERRYIAKWGGKPGEERFRTPYDDPGLPISFIQTDIASRARRQW